MATEKASSIFRRSTKAGEEVVLENSHASADMDNYQLLDSVGFGAYAKVYKAEVKSTKALIAAKIVSKAAAPTDYVKKFLPREIAVLQLIDHPNCIRTYEIFAVSNNIHMIMELASNGDLLEYINNRGRIGEPGARKIFSQVVSALEYFYSKNIAHRDLKCENLLLDEKFNIKVSDFGFATTYNDGDMLQTFCGSVAYACPEILYGQPYDGKYSDLWSIGVVLYALVCGQLPFQEGDMKRLLMQLNSPLALPSRLSTDCADLLRKILTTSLPDRATLADVQRHVWLKPRTVIVNNKRPVDIPDRRSPVTKRHDLDVVMDLARRKRSSTIDASELGAKPKHRLESPVASPLGSPVTTCVVSAESPKGQPAAASTTTTTHPPSKLIEDLETDAAAKRGRAMTGSVSPHELARQLSWRKRIRQNITQYISSPDNNSDSKKSKDGIKAIKEEI